MAKTNEIPVGERLCLWCEHCCLSTGHPDYSEYTAGELFDVECQKGHWSFQQCEAETTFRTDLLTARTCQDWKLNLAIANELKTP